MSEIQYSKNTSEVKQYAYLLLFTGAIPNPVRNREVWLLWTGFGIAPVNKLVFLTWLLWALRSFRSFTLHYITFYIVLHYITLHFTLRVECQHNSETIQPGTVNKKVKKKLHAAHEMSYKISGTYTYIHVNMNTSARHVHACIHYTYKICMRKPLLFNTSILYAHIHGSSLHGTTHSCLKLSIS